MTSEDRVRLRLLFDEAFELDQEGRESYLAQACPDRSLRAEIMSLLVAYDEAPEAEPLVLEVFGQRARGEAAEPTHDGRGTNKPGLGSSADARRSPDDAEASDVSPRSFDDTDQRSEGDLAHTDHDLIGRRVGPYRITAEIGHGGMGSVYRAVRDDGRFEKTVAVKVIRAGMDTATLLRRFEAEQRILAGLDHPFITRLLDGGRTQSGLPFFIMELVEGRAIDSYCDAKRLGIGARLQLFVRVCEAAQYAHSRLVVHRDLKPGNILIAEDGAGNPVPKLLDFGIAKLLLHEAGDGSGLEITAGHRLMTPAFASPEQLRGEPVSTACDVYALGLVLHRLLTGRLPYRAEERSMEAIRRAVLDEAPERPSSLVMRPIEFAGDPEGSISPDNVSRDRRTTPDALRRRLSGDLDTIVLTALQKEPDRRYGSAQQLADDVRRYLDGRPIAAHPDSVRYRSRKFLRRHWRSVGAAALVFISLLGGIAATAWQARIAEQERSRAERRFGDVRRMAGALLFDFHDAIEDLPGATPARELIVTRAIEYLDGLANEAEDDPALQLELAAAYRRVGDVQGNPTNANLGRTQEALQSYRKAIELLESLDVSDRQALLAAAVTREGLADVQAASGDLEGASISIEDAVSRYRALVAGYPLESDYAVHYAVGLIKQGDLQGNPNFPNRGRQTAALELYESAEPILHRLFAADSTNQRVFRLVGLIEERIGTIHYSQGDYGPSQEAFRRSLHIRERYAQEYPHNLDGIRDVGVANEKIGLLASASGDLDEALRRQRRAGDIFRALAESDSLNVQAWQSLAISLMHQGDAEAAGSIADRGDLGDHGDAADQGVLAYEGDVTDHSERPTGDDRTAISRYKEALRLLRSIREIDPSNHRTSTLIEQAEQRLEELPSPTARP